MKRQPFRTDGEGVLIDRDSPVRFDFGGHRYEGFEGDTLASALLAAGDRIVARSLKFHRPRGIWGFGSEEPNALVTVDLGERAEPNTKATQVPLHDGMKTFGQNAWPSVDWDAAAVLGNFTRLLPAGFYYKTFMRPVRWRRRLYEPVIRRMAGLGRAPEGHDPDRYARRHAHVDLLVVGGGPAGLAAALASARAGRRVLLADEGMRLGGDLLRRPAEIADGPASEWVERAVAELQAAPNARLLVRTTVAGQYDHKLLTAVQRVGDQPDPAEPGQPAMRLWLVRAREVVIAAGAQERPLVFADNDRPGVMSASAAAGYLHAYGVLAGVRIIVTGGNDTIYAVARQLRAGGAGIAAVVDWRTEGGGDAADLPIRRGMFVTRALGRRKVRGAIISRLDGNRPERIACDLIAVSGGWTPAVHLYSQAGGRLRFDTERGLFLPEPGSGAGRCIGAANGTFDLDGCLREGWAAGGGAPEDRPHSPEHDAGSVPPAPAAGSGLRFVDLQNDVTVDDVRLAAREGYRSVEHLKRYTILGMGPDQGRTSNMAGLAALSEALEVPIADIGVTTYRPPYAPVTIGAMAAGLRGEGRAALRRTAADDWHEAHGAPFTPAGLWRRARFYPREGMNEHAVIEAEVQETRGGSGLVDVSTLGKIDLQGPDAAALLDRLYARPMSDLAVGRGRYGLMLRDDGHVFDDGVVMRLGPSHFHLTTTTGGHARVIEHVEFHLQTVWPELEAYATDVTEQWFCAALVGPDSRTLLADLAPDLDTAGSALPAMSVREAQVAGLPARVFRVSFSGELSYEIATPADLGLALWTRIVAQGAPRGLGVYGTEAMGIMRIEMGHITHAEADGRTTAGDLGLDWAVGPGHGAIGKRSLDLPAMGASGRKQLVGIRAEDPDDRIPPGAQVVEEAGNGDGRRLGHITSFCRSPTLGCDIALGLVENGRERIGETVRISSPLIEASLPAVVAEPAFRAARKGPAR